ncbi:hypothetical protein GCM10025777_55420 [Membranihabitans marinus]
MLGYTLTQFKSFNNTENDCHIWCSIISLFSLIISIIIGLIITRSESKNYKLKYKISRALERKQYKNNTFPDNLKELESQCSNLENLNKNLTICQEIAIIIALILLILLMIIAP